MNQFAISRDVLVKMLDGNPRAVAQFEEIIQAVSDNSETTGANVEATTALSNATFLTLSANAELDNEFVLQVGEGLRIEASDGIARLFLDAPILISGHTVRLTTAGDSLLALPLVGVLATTENAETLKNKTLDAPKLSGLGDYADDTAAAGGGVPVGGVYHNAGALRVRLA